MFNLGLLETLLLLLNLAGVLLPVVGIVWKRLPVGVAVLAGAMAVFIPFLGGIASIVIVLTRWERDQPIPVRVRARRR